MNAHLLLPPEVAATSSAWFGRARNYPIFSRAWFRYRSIAMVTGVTLFGVLAALAGMPGRAPTDEADIAVVTGIVLATLYALCLIGPALAMKVRAMGLAPRRELAGLALALAVGAACSAGLWLALSNQYEQPVLDRNRDVLVKREMPLVAFSVDVNLQHVQHFTGLRSEIKAKAFSAAYQGVAEAFGLPDRLQDGWPSFLTAADRQLIDAVRSADGIGRPQLEEGYAVLMEKMRANTYDLVHRAADRQGRQPRSPQQEAAVQALIAAVKAAPVLPNAPTDGSLGNAILPLAGLLLAGWLGGFFDLRAYMRQRDKLDDVLAQEELGRARDARNAAELRLSVLAAQVEPHFLFNTLASVRSAIATDPQRAAHIVENMVDYLRASIPQMRSDAAVSMVTLGSQLATARAYLALMHERMPRLRFAVHAEPGLERAAVPPLMLISLVENAVKHGVEPKVGAANIVVAARRAIDSEVLELSVTDDGVGFGAATGGGIGLANIQERLRSYFGQRASLTLKACPEGGVAAILRLPLSFDI